MQQEYALVRKMKSGDEEAMELFVREYYPQILKYCYYHYADKDMAQDLTQETFERFFGNLSTYHHRGKALSYLYTIARNLCIDKERKARYENCAPGGAADIGDMEDGGVLREDNVVAGGQGTSVKSETERIEQRIALENALAKLPDELREVVILHYFQEFSLRECAALLRIGLPLVKYRIRKAKEKLKEALQ